jgi:hypothetical protein
VEGIGRGQMKVLSRHLPGRTEENHENLRLYVFGMRFVPGTSQIRTTIFDANIVEGTKLIYRSDLIVCESYTVPCVGGHTSKPHSKLVHVAVISNCTM